MQELTVPTPVALMASHPDASRPLFEHMLDVVDYGILLLQPDGRVLFANRAAREELDDHALLCLRGAVLQLQRAEDAKSLREALASAVHKGCQRLLTLGNDTLSTLAVAVVPMIEPGTSKSVGAMLLLGKRQVCDELSVESFGRLHRLTLAELRVLKLLCTGHRPAEIASILGVALSTVRTQVSSSLEKTCMPSIGALLHAVSRLPPLRNLLRAA